MDSKEIGSYSMIELSGNAGAGSFFLKKLRKIAVIQPTEPMVMMIFSRLLIIALAIIKA